MMNFVDFLEATFKLGLPLFLLSWLIFSKLYEGGAIARGGNKQEAQQQLKASYKAAKKKPKGSSKTHVDRVIGHWSSFGGGFYGLAALWTFAVIEVKDMVSFIFQFPGLDVLLENGLINLLVGIIVNQVTNAVSAFIWFSYWPSQSIVVWVLIAYFSYWLGMELAKKGYGIPLDKWAAASRRWFD
jgi:hypothetical protein